MCVTVKLYSMGFLGVRNILKLITVTDGCTALNTRGKLELHTLNG